MLAAVVALTSCNYEPEGWHGTIFEGKSSEVVFDESKIDYAFGPQQGTTIEIPVSRGTATEAYTTAIEILDAQGNSIANNPDYALMVVNQAKFEVGQYEAVATISFDRRQFTAGTKVGFYLYMEPTQIDTDVTVCSLSILRDYTWSEYCEATLESDFWVWWMEDEAYAAVPCVVHKAEGFPFYRVYNGLTKTLDIEFKFVDGVFCPVGTLNSYKLVVFESGLSAYAKGDIVRWVDTDPEYAFYSPDYNAIVSDSFYFCTSEGGIQIGYFSDVWYCDKALVTE